MNARRQMPIPGPQKPATGSQAPDATRDASNPATSPESRKRGASARAGRGGIVFICVFVGMGLYFEAQGTAERNRKWHDDETLWGDAVVKSPHNGRNWMNLGVALMAKGKFAEAEYNFERARLYWPTYSLIEVNLGVLCAATNRDDEAQWHFNQAIKLNPTDASSYSYYDVWKKQKGWK